MVGRLQHVRYRQVLWAPLVCSDNHKQSECTTTVWVHNRGFRLLDMHEPTRLSTSYLRNKLLRVRSRVPNERGTERGVGS